jgi:hypothetical protein
MSDAKTIRTGGLQDIKGLVGKPCTCCYSLEKSLFSKWEDLFLSRFTGGSRQGDTWKPETLVAGFTCPHGRIIL